MKLPNVTFYSNSGAGFYTGKMAGKKMATPSGRQAAYAARNRAALVKAGQEVLAEIGPSATIEQLAGHAQVSPTTIYKYFGNKDALFIEALNHVWENWLEWARQDRAPGDPLELTLDSGRKLFFAKETHPFFAKILHNVLAEDPYILIKSDQGKGAEVFKHLASKGLLEKKDFEKRYLLWTSMYAGLCRSVFLTEELTPAEANTAFGVGLSIWGISEAKAKKIISRLLVLTGEQ
jgi:AcrR family transcriptional regulator